MNQDELIGVRKSRGDLCQRDSRRLSGVEVGVKVVAGRFGGGTGGGHGGFDFGETAELGGLQGSGGRVTGGGAGEIDQRGELEPTEKLLKPLLVEVGDAGGLVDAGEPADVGVS